MRKNSIKNTRINGEVQKALSDIIRLELKDPRIHPMTSVVLAQVTPDLKYAKIYYSALRGDEKELSRGLRAASSFIRSELAHRMNLRITPELTFVRDASLAHGAHIASLLHQLEEENPHCFDDDADERDEEDDRAVYADPIRDREED